MLPQLLALSLALGPSLASAAIFPDNSLVKMIDAKGFKAALKDNMTSIVAFVAPWCGHCQKLAPEYSRAALGLYPLVPLYAVDCDAAANKRLCADQGVKGFPTIKMFPRGKTMKPVEYDSPERTASAFYYWASRGIPIKMKKIHDINDIPKWAKDDTKPRALLMNKSNKMPLLWTVLANKYKDQILFASHRDRKGKSSVKMGFDAGPDGTPKVLLYPVGETNPMRYEGLNRFESLSTFFDSVLDGTVDIKLVNQQAASEEFVPDPVELEIEQRQEAEMLKLAHGGYAEMIDFEAAVKDGSAKDFHQSNGYPGMMGAKPAGVPGAGSGAAPPFEHGHAGGSEGAVKESSKAQGENPRTPKTGDAGQIVLDMKTETGQPRTPVAAATEAAAAPEPPVEPTVATENAPEPTATEDDHVKDEL